MVSALLPRRGQLSAIRPGAPCRRAGRPLHHGGQSDIRPGTAPVRRAMRRTRPRGLRADVARVSRQIGQFMNGRQFVYHMQGLSKTYPGNRKVLENINLSFYPDAKIGVLGLNGSGKSTLLRIMAGIDTDFVGDGWVAEGARVGYLPQEPQLDDEKSVRENVMEG